MIGEGSLKGIGLFALEVMHLISSGKKETLATVEEHFEKKDIVEYLSSKYKDEFFIVFDNSIYDNEQINLYFFNYVGYIEGNERRKYGIMNEDDGLLLIVSLLTDKIEKEAIHWKVEEQKWWHYWLMITDSAFSMSKFASIQRKI